MPKQTKQNSQNTRLKITQKHHNYIILITEYFNTMQIAYILTDFEWNLLPLCFGLLSTICLIRIEPPMHKIWFRDKSWDTSKHETRLVKFKAKYEPASCYSGSKPR